MSLLTLTSRVRRQRCAPATTTSPALPPRLRRRVQLSADLLATLLEMEGRERPTLDDLEWADAVAAGICVRQAARRAG